MTFLNLYFNHKHNSSLRMYSKWIFTENEMVGKWIMSVKFRQRDITVKMSPISGGNETSLCGWSKMRTDTP